MRDLLKSDNARALLLRIPHYRNLIGTNHWTMRDVRNFERSPLLNIGPRREAARRRNRETRPDSASAF